MRDRIQSELRPREPQGPKTQTAGARVLVVGGQDSASQRLGALLTQSGLCSSTEYFETGSEALSACLARGADYIFLSTTLPDVSASDFLEQLPSSNPTELVPPVILFGSDQSSVADTIRSGAQDFINLDTVTPEELCRTVQYANERQASLQLRERLELSERMATLGRLAAGVAHEINNPAAYALSNLSQLNDRLQVLREQATLALPQEQHSLFGILQEVEEMVADSLEGVSRIATIVSEMQQFARSRPHDNQWTDLRQVAEVALRLTQNRLRHRCQVMTDLQPTRRFVADQGKLVQVVINLIDNASKALGGLSDDMVRISTGTQDGYSWLAVDDTGHGIPERIAKKIFEPFFTTGEASAGTGLGLTLSREYAERHRGHLHYEPRPTGGSRFVLTIPRDTGLAVVVSRAPRRTRDRARTSNRVLLIDDEPAVLRAFRRVLEPTYTVTLAGGGQHALQLLNEGHDFDAVVCDVNMPDLSGVEFYRRLELLRPELARRVVFCSGGVFGEHTREFIESTRNPVLHKPLAPQALLEAMSSFLSNRKTA